MSPIAVAQTKDEIDSVLAGHVGPVVLVPTMGALHEGHLSLVRRAQEVENAAVIVSIFVNPLQFGENEDLDAYPRTWEQDLSKLAEIGADVVFAPREGYLYPHGKRTTVRPSRLATQLEGEMRTNHFEGVLTVVSKLFNLTGCTHAVFGEKDYQQLILVRELVADLDFNVEVIGAPIIREDSGLAKSSRNKYLSAEEAKTATVLNKALRAGAQYRNADAVIAAAQEVLRSEKSIEVAYLELRDARLAEPKPGENRLLVAALVGRTRLLDNIAVFLD